MDRLTEIENRILEIKKTKIARKREIEAKPIAMPFIEGQTRKMEKEFEDELDLLETERQFLVDRGGAKQIGEKITRRLKTEGYFVQANADKEDIHLMIGSRERSDGQKVHAIVDGVTGEVRLEEGPETPHDVLESIESVLTTKSGERFKVTRTQVAFTAEALPQSANLLANYSSKDGYHVIELYNGCKEDVLLGKMEITWKQLDGDATRLMEDFAVDTDNLAMDRPRKVRVLKQGERVFGLNPPGATVDGWLKVTLEFTGVASGKLFEKTVNIETPKLRA